MSAGLLSNEMLMSMSMLIQILTQTQTLQLRPLFPRSPMEGQRTSQRSNQSQSR